MNNGSVIILYVLLTLNALRYGTYILEGHSSSYYITMLSLNLLVIIFTITYRAVKAKKSSEADIAE
ncbi:hypothetical protein JEOAER750_01843 [Jeotgalicoccus aerolatus]|uniref:Uncharacterized protein n=2 Tax=Jeotgalicoccus TaxID=227979 RepID=A0A078M0T7_9STAP|nr:MULTISPECIES: hypothetical protein [Jeotgalicoccus]MBP1951099.1 hypothetical protein [Jeotgalicoccus aerolatus]GGE00271.1 hypothetical protein GCM10007273_10800 [Jeotgalicoccus aerolatus]CAD2078121.1 hypothetical protein JEOAER750_01843 [Jeotgalicoccus aerolatus]CDZ99012.1 hypothetical protein BN1048_00131 [Jeotgalicoccus saudimassiliensis]